MDLKVLTERRINFPEQRNAWMSSISFQQNGKWFNCLYLHLIKDKWPLLEYPKIASDEKSFEYYDGDFKKLDWHGGITFYEETIVLPRNTTVVKAGCDYQHYMDDYYMAADHGDIILMNHGQEIWKQFLEMYKNKEVQANKPITI